MEGCRKEDRVQQTEDRGGKIEERRGIRQEVGKRMKKSEIMSGIRKKKKETELK